MLVQLVVNRPSADPNALQPESVAARIQPVGRVEFGAPAAAPGARTGEAIVKATCATCHQTGVANAPRIGDAKAWAPHIKAGLKGMVATVIKGKGAMPPQRRRRVAHRRGDRARGRATWRTSRAASSRSRPRRSRPRSPEPSAGQQQAQAPAAPVKPAPDAKPAAERKAGRGRRQGGLRQGLRRLPRPVDRRIAPPGRQGRMGAAHPAGHGRACPVGDQGQGRHAARARAILR